MSTISIITPFKDAAPFFKQCIDSICRQSHDDWQLIAIDDHSSDHSREIIESYKDKRIQVRSNSGKGILAALATGQQFISGSYVTRIKPTCWGKRYLKAMVDYSLYAIQTVQP